MAITTTERTKLREELVGQGYSWKYIDEWQPKVTLFRHRVIKNPNGEIVSPAGTKLENLPGNPDYVNRKGRIGLYPWPPSNTCTCRWCVRVVREPEKVDSPVVRLSPTRTGKVGPYFDPQ